MPRGVCLVVCELCTCKVSSVVCECKDVGLFICVCLKSWAMLNYNGCCIYCRTWLKRNMFDSLTDGMHEAAVHVGIEQVGHC